MSKIQQLLAKAMSTASEDEAVACLRMARKHGGKASDVPPMDDPKPSGSLYNGQTAKQWYDKANELYRANRVIQTNQGLIELELERARRKCKLLEIEVRDAKNSKLWKIPVIALVVVAMNLMAVSITIDIMKDTQRHAEHSANNG